MACTDYSKRLPRELPLQWTTVVKTKGISEAQRISRKIRPGSYNLALDEKGKQWTSRDWSRQLKYWMQGYPSVNFIIGGPDGLAGETLQNSHANIALGRITMPHALVRVVLVEQLYRAWCIYEGHPYHRE